MLTRIISVLNVYSRSSVGQQMTPNYSKCLLICCQNVLCEGYLLYINAKKRKSQPSMDSHTVSSTKIVSEPPADLRSKYRLLTRMSSLPCRTLTNWY